MFLATPAEVIDHYYCFLADNLDNSVISQTMLKLKVITEEDLIDSAKMCSDYQQNAFLLDQLLITDTSKVNEFCHMLQSTENEREIGKMLVNGEGVYYNLLICYQFFYLSTTAIESIPADDMDAVMEVQSSGTPSQAASSEEDDTDISPVYQPEVFLAAKTIHIRFLNLHCDPQTFLEALNKLNATVKTVGHLALLPSDYLEDFSSTSTEKIPKGFLWTWNNHSILRALLEACSCQDGIKMLDDFESQIDTNQPLELFPIPPPSMKIAPSLSSGCTVLSIREEYSRDEPVPLQYVHDVARIMIEKLNISSHALQLLAARSNPLMLYWMIPKSVVPLISEGVNEHLDFLKENGLSEIAIYPNTILFATDNLSHGSFALLSIQPQVSIFL